MKNNFCKLKISPIISSPKWPTKIFALLLLLMMTAQAADVPIAIIYVDEKTESKLGNFPIDRKYYAQALDILAKDHNPKIIVIKMFFDVKNSSDAIFINTAKKYKHLYTQAFASKGQTPWKGKLPLTLLGKAPHDWSVLNNGWIPGEEMASAFQGIGLVNAEENDHGEATGFYLLNSIMGEAYASLPLLLAADWTGKILNFDGKILKIGEKEITLKPNGSIDIPEMPTPAPWTTYSFIDLLQNKIKKGELKGKLVFFFYLGKNATPVHLAHGKMSNQAEIVALVTRHLILAK